MNWDKILAVLKIPLKVLLPSVWLFSGFLICAKEDVLSSLGMLGWKTENSFVFGLLFLISSSLIAVYVFWFVKEKVSSLISKMTFRRKVLKALERLNDVEINIIMTLYKSEGYTNVVDFNDPIVKGLLARQFIYIGNNQMVSAEWDNSIPAKVSLQPFVYQALNHEVEVMRIKIKKITQRIAKTKSEKKKAKLQSELSQLQMEWKYYEEF